MLADIKGPHLDFFGGPNSLSHGSGRSSAEAPYWITSVFYSAPAFVVLRSTSRAINSIPPNKSVYISPERGSLNVPP